MAAALQRPRRRGSDEFKAVSMGTMVRHRASQREPLRCRKGLNIARPPCVIYINHCPQTCRFLRGSPGDHVKLSPEFARIVFWLAVASCVVAQLGILWSTWRGMAARAGQTETPSADASGAPLNIRRAPELVWAILPAVALVLVFAGTWRAMQHLSDASASPMHRHPPATVSGAPSHLASNGQPTQRKAAVRRGTPAEPSKSMMEPVRTETVEVPEVPER